MARSSAQWCGLISVLFWVCLAHGWECLIDVGIVYSYCTWLVNSIGHIFFVPSNLLQVAAFVGARCDGTGVGVSAGTVAERQGSTGSRRGAWTGHQNRYEMSWATHDPPRLRLTRSLISIPISIHTHTHIYIYICYIQIYHNTFVNIPEPTGFSLIFLNLFPNPSTILHPFRRCPATEAKKLQSLQDVLSKRVVQLEAKLHQQDMEKDAMKEETNSKQLVGNELCCWKGLECALGMFECSWTGNYPVLCWWESRFCFPRAFLARSLSGLVAGHDMLW